MRPISFLTFLLASAFALLLQAAPASAQATRTWVSGVGDDANPCSRTAPCKTFAGAISKTAAGGEINALDPGGYGAVTITKGMTIDGGGFIASSLVTGSNSIVVNAGATDRIVLRNIQLDGISGSTVGAGLNGVNILAGQIVELENVRIANFGQSCVKAQVAGVVSLIVSKSELFSCTGGGILSSGGTGINKITIANSIIGRSGTGIQAGANTNATIFGSTFTNNGTVAVLASAATSQITLDQSTVTNGGIGVQASGNSIIRLANTSVTNNAGQGLLADTGGQILTWSNNWVAGNTPDGTRTGTILPQ